MKKTFTLIFALCAAFAVNAQTLVNANGVSTPIQVVAPATSNTPGDELLLVLKET